MDRGNFLQRNTEHLNVQLRLQVWGSKGGGKLKRGDESPQVAS